ncbi:MAG: hypothetical protein DRH57_03125 [Candidatus Cloacimonadota bacterium]|nr:MAG: hypothetical protein DRH57_03125 [Candidatus Cloacimonadota bacterium]
MNINKPEKDIDIEIKKMKSIDCMVNPRISAEEMVLKFGFPFVRNFVLKITNVSEKHSAYSMNKNANRVLTELHLLKPIDTYPEAWL